MEIKNFFNRLSRTVDTEESVNFRIELTKLNTKKKKWKKHKASKRCGTISNSLIHVTGKEEEKNEAEEILQAVIAKYFPKLMKDNRPQIQEARRSPSSIKTKQNLDTS